MSGGCRPGDGPLVVEVGSTTSADGGEVPHARLRKGSANTARGILRFVDELLPGCAAPAPAAS